MTNLLPCVLKSTGIDTPVPEVADLTDLRVLGAWVSESLSTPPSAETTAVARIYSLALYQIKVFWDHSCILPVTQEQQQFTFLTRQNAID